MTALFRLTDDIPPPDPLFEIAMQQYHKHALEVRTRLAEAMGVSVWDTVAGLEVNRLTGEYEVVARLVSEVGYIPIEQRYDRHR